MLTKMLLEEKHNGQIYNLVGPLRKLNLLTISTKFDGTNPSHIMRYQLQTTTERKKSIRDFHRIHNSGIYEELKIGKTTCPLEATNRLLKPL
jgi:hypothetical protein